MQDQISIGEINYQEGRQQLSNSLMTLYNILIHICNGRDGKDRVPNGKIFGIISRSGRMIAIVEQPSKPQPLLWSNQGTPMTDLLYLHGRRSQKVH